MKRKKYQFRLANNCFLLTLLIFPYLKPASLEYFAPEWDRFFDIYKIFSFVIILGIYIFNGKYSKLICGIIGYQIILFISTILHNGNYWGLAVNCGATISFSMITEYVLKQNPKLFFKSVSYVYCVMLPVDFLLYLIYPNGFSRMQANTWFFLSNRNGFAGLFIPVIVCLCIYSSFWNSKIKFFPLVALSCGSLRLIMTWSATGIVSWFILLVYIVVFYKTYIAKFIDIWKYYFVFLLFQMCFVFFRIQEYFKYIIEVILKKSVTFTGRTEIWDLSFLLIKRSPIFGYGVYEGNGLIFWHNGYYYSHNGILEVMLQGGIVALLFFVVLFLIAAFPLYNYRRHYISGIVSTGIFSMLIIMLAEAQINSIWLFVLLVIATCIKQIIIQVESEKRKEYNYNGRNSETFYYYSRL